MSTNEDDSSAREQRANEAIAAYLEAVDAGEAPDPEEFVAQHADVAAELEAFFANRAQFERLAEPLKPAAVEETLPTPHNLANGKSTPALAPGSKLRYFGDYELLEEIARGGMGVVYKARQSTLKRIVALKMILSGQLAGEEDVKRFHAEAEAAAKLDHPNIVPIFEIGQHEGQHYFSMALVDGESLARKVAEGPLPPREAARLIRKVAEAVAYAHVEGVVHRDLKPANVLLDKDGEPRVTDFGLAKRISPESLTTEAADSAGLTTTGQILGTPSYMPPEQAAGKTDEIGPLADVYSLGAMLYCLLTGRPPFQAASPMETLIQVLQQEPVSVRLLNPKVPRDLDTICLKCLEKETRKRYASASELTEELQRVLDGEPIQARPISKPAYLWRWCKRKPGVASLTATVAILLLAGATIATYSAFEFQALAEKESVAANNERDARGKADAARNEAETERDRAQAAREQSLKEKERAEQAERETSAYLYAARMSLAQQAWEAANIEQMVDVLDLYRPGANGVDRRGFEWYYLWRLCHQELRTLDHKSPVTSIAVSPNGRTLASVSSSGGMRVWDTATGELISTKEGSQFTAAFSPDGSTLAGADLETVELWDAATGELKGTLSGHTNPVASVAFSPDGNTLASGSGDGTVILWDLATSQPRFTLRGHTKLVYSVAFSLDGSTLASGSGDDTVKLWDVNTGNERASLTGHASYVRSVSFSPDGHILASASGDRSIKLWDVKTGAEMATSTGHDWAVNCVAFSPDGTAIASASQDRTVKIWSVPTLELKATINGHTDEVNSVAFLHDGRRLASASEDGTVKLWDVAGQQGSGHLDGMTAAFSPDGATLATGGADGLIRFWDVSTGELKSSIKGFSSYVFSLSFFPNGKTLATVGAKSPRTPPGETELKLWDVLTGKQLKTLGEIGGVNPVAVSPDGKTLATALYERVDRATFQGLVKLWDVSTGDARTTLQAHTEPISSIAFSPDGRTLASAGGNNSTAELMLWNLVTRDEPTILEGHTSQLICVSFSPNGKILASGGIDQTIKLWDVRRGQLLATLRDHSGPVVSVAFSPDGKTLASAGFDKTVILWDAATGQRRITLTGHTDLVASVVFSPDGKTLASGSRDNVVKLWRAATQGTRP